MSPAPRPPSLGPGQLPVGPASPPPLSPRGAAPPSRLFPGKDEICTYYSPLPCHELQGGTPSQPSQRPRLFQKLHPLSPQVLRLPWASKITGNRKGDLLGNPADVASKWGREGPKVFPSWVSVECAAVSPGTRLLAVTAVLTPTRNW